METLFEFYTKEINYPKHQVAAGEIESVEDFDNGNWCYLMFCPTTKLSKIGISSSPTRRKGELMCQSGVEVYLVLAIQPEIGYDEPANVIELAIHKFYKKKRAYGEWFNLSLRDYSDIKNLFYSVIVGWNIIDNISELSKQLKK